MTSILSSPPHRIWVNMSTKINPFGYKGRYPMNTFSVMREWRQKEGRIFPRMAIVIAKHSFRELWSPCHTERTRDDNPAQTPLEDRADIRNPVTRAETADNIRRKKILSRYRVNWQWDKIPWQLRILLRKNVGQRKLVGEPSITEHSPWYFFERPSCWKLTL